MADASAPGSAIVLARPRATTYRNFERRAVHTYQSAFIPALAIGHVRENLRQVSGVFGSARRLTRL